MSGMFDINKNYWLYIAPHVYCCIKEGKALLYNTQSGANIETENSDVITLLQALHRRENLGVIFCNGKMLAEAPFSEFITEYFRKEMGGIIDVFQMPKKPIQLMPILNLQNDVDNLQMADDRCIGENVLQNLLELNVYIYNICNQNCTYCKSYYRQCLCCYSGEKDHQNHSMTLQILSSLLSQIKYSAVGKLNLLGGDIFEYPHYKELMPLLSDFKGRIHIWNHYTGFTKHRVLNDNFIYDVAIPYPLSESLLSECLLSLNSLKYKAHFYVTCTEEYGKCIEFIDKYRISAYSIHPIYTGTNFIFFEDYVCLNKEDILRSGVLFNRIFARQKMNTNHFGKLTVLANGDTYAEVNTKKLGNLQNEGLLDIINLEMHMNTAWRAVRDDVPCRDCLYQYLCPSPSAYEKIIGRINLCHVK